MSNTNIQRIAAFSDAGTGGNPAGVYIADALPAAADMQRIAAEVGFSETVFAMPIAEGWRVRYFSPESEVPFCGHATIALGAALARQSLEQAGSRVFTLVLNEATITVEGSQNHSQLFAALQSPPTRSNALGADLLSEVLSLFGYHSTDLDPNLPAALAHGGANHLVVALNSREALAAMDYDLDKGRALMNREKLITIVLVWAETPQRFHTRNPFASGGVFEDPATGAATAALAGYLRDIQWPHAGVIDIVQGEDMGQRSLLRAEIPPEAGSSIRVSGEARLM